MFNFTDTDKLYKKVIAQHIKERIATDKYLDDKCCESTKTLDGVLNYVKSEAKKQAENGVAVIPDEQVFEWAVHYILEDSLDFEKKPEEKKEHKYEPPVIKTPEPIKKEIMDQLTFDF